MSFPDLKLKTEYRSLHDDIVSDFFNPVLKQSTIYKRAVGYFSSSGLMALSEGIFDLIEKGGSIQLIISPQLSEEDLYAIHCGFKLDSYNSVDVNMIRLANNSGCFDKPRLNFLCNLIATGILKIKVAFLDESNGLGRFNEKMGLMYDAEGNIIAFSGSMNESANAFTKNYDSIDIFTSWTKDFDRVNSKEAEFDSLWNDKVKGVNVSDFDFTKIKSVSYDEMAKIKTPEKFFAEDYEEKPLQSGVESLWTVVNRAFERIQHVHNHPNELTGVPTGLIELNKITNGLQKSDLIILAARPSMGKTALALNIATAAAKEDNVLFFSLEMSKEQLATRLLSTASGVNSQKLNTGNFDYNEMISVIDSAYVSAELKLFIDDTLLQTLNKIRATARNFKSKFGLGLIIIDYIQLMQGSKEYRGNRVQEMSEISRGLKALARELDIPILAVSQLSRNVEQRENKRPQLSDLRESGSIEQDADIVMFLYRDEYYNRDEADNQNIAELIIVKNRNGPTTSFRLKFQKSIMRFGNLTRSELNMEI